MSSVRPQTEHWRRLRPAPDAEPILSGWIWQRAGAEARALSYGVEPAKYAAAALAAADAAVIIAVSLVFPAVQRASAGLHGPRLLVTDLAATGLTVILMLLVRQMDGGYAAELRIGVARQCGKAVRAWAVTGMVLLTIAYATRTSDLLPRSWTGLCGALVLGGLVMNRLAARPLLRRWRRQGRFARIVAVVDLAGNGTSFARALCGASAGDIHLIGVFGGTNPAAGAKGVEDLVSLSALFRVDEVLVTVAGAQGDDVPRVLGRLATIPTKVRVCPVLPDLGTTPVRDAAQLLGNPVLTVCDRPLAGWNTVLKRGEDLVLGSLMLAALAMPMLAIAIAVRLDSPGPALFRQGRSGFNNNPITVFKFRSMTHDTKRDEHGVVQARRGDARVTRLGRFLRRTSLDELPQLFNVLRGEMSLVGPRPHAIVHNQHYAGLIDGYLGRHRVQPGITGWAQVNGFRGETDTLDKMQARLTFDLAYIERWSILFDLRIIAKTAVVALFDRNAY
jgi:putative colanic acid biosynthesis UDP-glucose lipid carrier transferase